MKLRFHIARCHQAIGEYQDLCHELNVQVMAQARAVAQAAVLDVRKPGLLVSDTSSAFVPSTGQGYAEAIDAAAVRQASAVMFGTAVGSEVERSEAAAAAARARARARAAAARSKQQEQAAADANGGGGESGVAEDGPQQRHVAAVGAVNLLCLRANAIKQRTLALALLHEQVCGSVWQCVCVCWHLPIHPSLALCVLLALARLCCCSCGWSTTTCQLRLDCASCARQHRYATLVEPSQVLFTLTHGPLSSHCRRLYRSLTTSASLQASCCGRPPSARPTPSEASTTSLPLCLLSEPWRQSGPAMSGLWARRAWRRKQSRHASSTQYSESPLRELRW